MSANGYKRLKKYILFSMILAPVAIYVISLSTGYFFFANSLQNTTISTMKRIVKDHRQMIESFLAERQGDLLFVTHTYSYKELSDPEALGAVYKVLKKKSGAFMDLGIFNQDGVHVSYQGPYDLSGKIYQNESWFKEVMKKGYYLSNVYKGFRNVPHFVIAVVKEEKNQKWVLRATIDTYFFNTLVEQLSIGKTGEAYILNEKGILQTRRRSGGELMEPVSNDPDLLLFHDEIRVFEQKDQDNEEYLVATAWLNNRSWMLVVRQGKADAFHSLSAASYIIALITVIGILIIIFLSFILSSKIIRRMEIVNKEKESLQFQLIRAGGLAELGEMATGFAHEINNPLQIIKNEQKLIQLFLRDLIEKQFQNQEELITDLEDSLDQIGLQIDRCARITQAILKFGRMSKPEYKEIEIKKFIPEILAMVEKKASVNGIQLTYRMVDQPAPVCGDPAQLQQIILNLINNAIDAVIEQHGSLGGKIELSVFQVKPGEIDIAVKDNGAGISSENLSKVFTPFFTTKPVGKGTGLGLSVCYGIVKKMGGHMDVKSQLGKGTTFTLHFPRLKKQWLKS